MKPQPYPCPLGISRLHIAFRRGAWQELCFTCGRLRQIDYATPPIVVHEYIVPNAVEIVSYEQKLKEQDDAIQIRSATTSDGSSALRSRSREEDWHTAERGAGFSHSLARTKAKAAREKKRKQKDEEKQ